MGVYRISQAISQAGQYITPGAKPVSRVLRSLDNANNIQPLLKDKAQSYGFSLETLRPGRIKKWLRALTDLFQDKDALIYRKKVAQFVNEYEQALIERAEAHQKRMSQGIYPWTA